MTEKAKSTFLESQAVLRDRLIKIIKAHPSSMEQLSRDIKISPITLKKFLYDPEATIAMMQLLKIENYVENKEKK